jgi:hypothetical protein
VSARRPAVPKPDALDPAIETWPAGRPIYRIYSRRFGVLGFNSTRASSRFRPVFTGTGRVVPTAYGGEDRETAFAEVLLRGVKAAEKGRRRLYLKEVDGLDLAMLVPQADLPLARLRGQGLTRLGLTRKHVIDCEEAEYPYTAEWAQALYDCRRAPVGIVWTSRQNDSGRACVLWEGRVRPRRALKLDGAPIALDSEPGIDLVRQACAYAVIDFEG